MERINIYFLIIYSIFLCSCSSMKRNIIKVQNFNEPPVTDTSYIDTTSWIWSKQQYKIRHLKDELISTFSYFSNKSINYSHRKKVINLILDLNTEMVRISDTSLFGFNANFLHYMPKATTKYRNPNWYKIKNITSYKNFIKYDPFYQNKKHFSFDALTFNITTKYFPNKFIFPIDYYNYYFYTEIGKYKNVKTYYLFLHIPEYIKIKVNWKNRINGPNGFHQEYLITETLLLLNSAFEEPYSRSIKYIWELYLFKVKYNDLHDTLQCNGKLPTYSIRKLRKNKPYFYSYPCHPKLYSQNVQTYLEKAIDKGPEMYKSYFALIFWQMYQPKDFKVKDNNGEKRSFTFTSTSERFPGKYKVKFNIYRPYEFKVVRQ